LPLDRRERVGQVDGEEATGCEVVEHLRDAAAPASRELPLVIA
jgi:hypothetical protein